MLVPPWASAWGLSFPVEVVVKISKPVLVDRWVLRFRYRYRGVDGQLHWMPFVSRYSKEKWIVKRFSSLAKAEAFLKLKSGCLDFESLPIEKITEEVCYLGF